MRDGPKLHILKWLTELRCFGVCKAQIEPACLSSLKTDWNSRGENYLSIDVNKKEDAKVKYIGMIRIETK